MNGAAVETCNMPWGAQEACPADAGLVRRAQARDEAAFRELVERYQPKVFAVIRAVLYRSNDAEDIVQQVFVKVYRGIGQFDGRNSLAGWIYRIAVNECYDYLRKRRVRRLTYEADLGTAEDPGRGLSAATSAEQSQEIRLIQRDYALWLLSQVSEQERFLMVMKEVEGRSVAELAAMTGLTENCIKVKLFRARQRMIRAARNRGGPGKIAQAPAG